MSNFSIIDGENDFEDDSAYLSGVIGAFLMIGLDLGL